jgi:PPOX class probable F420-dependent enzyme
VADVNNGSVAFNTARGTAKERHLNRDPRVSLLVIDPSNPYKWVAVSGAAELTEEGADKQIDKLAKKYLGKDEYPRRRPGMIRVSINITPEQIDASGFDGH